MSLRHRHTRGLALTAVALAGSLALAPNLLAVSAADIPTTNPLPQPRSVAQEIKLAGDYFMGHGVPQDLKLAAYWYEKAAEAGDPQAQMQIGYFYETGTGVDRNLVRAAHWYQLAASGGLVAAKVNLGSAYMWGAGMPKNPQLALQLFREAANQGSGLGACYLGDMYYSGDGVPQDREIAEQWYAKAAKMHNPRAEYHLGLLLFDVKDHPHDLRKAASLLRDAASQGYVASIYSLGLLLVRNPDLAKSSTEAITLLNDAADAGVWQASTVLGVLSRDGRLVQPDSSAAYLHFRVAALQGGEEAKKTLDADLRRLSAELDSNHVHAIDTEAETWYQAHHVALEFVFKQGDNKMRFPAYAVAVPDGGGHAGRLLPAIPN